MSFAGFFDQATGAHRVSDGSTELAHRRSNHRIRGGIRRDSGVGGIREPEWFIFNHSDCMAVKGFPYMMEID